MKNDGFDSETVHNSPRWKDKIISWAGEKLRWLLEWEEEWEK